MADNAGNIGQAAGANTHAEIAEAMAWTADSDRYGVWFDGTDWRVGPVAAVIERAA